MDIGGAEAEVRRIHLCGVRSLVVDARIGLWIGLEINGVAALRRVGGPSEPTLHREGRGPREGGLQVGPCCA